MSENKVRVVDQNGRSADQIRREADVANSDYETAIGNYNDYVNKSAQDTIDNGNKALSQIERKSADAIGSKGYNQSGGSSSNSTNSGYVPRKDGLNRPQTPMNNDNSNQPYDSRESAPDIGKDYGDSMPNPGENGYEQYGSVPHDGAGEPVDRDGQQAQQQAAQQAQQQAEKDSGSHARDDLEKEKEAKEKEEEEKKKAEEESKKAQENGQDSSSAQPQAQQGQNPQAAQANQQQGQQNQANKQGNNGLDSAEDTQKKASNNQTGNGYGALRRNNKNQPQPTDATQNARRNMNHQNKVNGLKGGAKRGLGAGLGAGMMAGLGNKVKSGFKNLFNRANNDFSDGNRRDDSEHDDSFLSNMMSRLMSSIMSNPYLLIVVGVVILFLIILVATMDDSGRGKKTCTYTLSGLSSTGPVQIKDAKVELINCDGSEKNGYEVLATIDFEKYILGVTLAEAGTGHPSDDTYKAQIIAVRNFTLTRHLGMCPSHPEECFHGYNFETNTFRMRACTNDQVYWDYTQDCPAQDRDGKPTLYCFGVENPNKTWKTALSDEEIARYEAIAEEVMGEVLLDENGDVMKLGYKAPQTEQFISMGTEGKDYKEILGVVYGSDNVQKEARCTYSKAFDYGDYTLTSDDDTVLNEPLDTFLRRNGTSLEEFNELIEHNVDRAGFGTRHGVVAAAVTLIGELGDNYGVKVPYFWGGGHADGVVVGALAKWGSTECNTSANGRVYDRCGLDCSGFVPWAIKNGGFGMAQNLASNFQYISGARRVSLSSSNAVVQPGDLLESESHVVLVVGIDEENKQYICAEAAGYDYGVLFMRRPFGSDGYWGVDMEDYYNNESNIRESG